MNGKRDDLYLQALCLTEVVLRTFEHKGKLDVTSKPIPKIRPIVESNKRMKIVSLGKFHGAVFISVINFYVEEGGGAIGALIVYIGEKYILDLFTQMGYPDLDENDEKEMEDAVGTFANILAGKFKLAITQLGFIELEMSHFSTYQNEVPDGVAYDRSQKRKYEIAFEIEDEMALMVELTLGRVPKSKAE